MKNSFSEIEKIINNPALGAYLFWIFCRKYKEKKPNKETPSVYLFCILALIFDKDIREIISSTQVSKGLRFALSKFEKNTINKTDIIYSVRNKIINLRDRSLESILIALHYELLKLNDKTGNIFPNDSIDGEINFDPPYELTDMIKNTEKLGVWFSQNTTHEIQRILRIEF